jgi:group I intron endonuclease
MIKGVYCIKNTRTGRCYIGSSLCIEKRIEDHFKALKKGRHYNRKLQKAFNRDKRYFMWEVLKGSEAYIDRDKLYEMEQYYIDTTVKLFNILLDAKAHLIKNKKRRLRVGLKPRQKRMKL